jgi:hypothetical protein
MIEEGQELTDVVCAAYKMGCDQTREVYKKRIEKLEAAVKKVLSQCSWYRTDQWCAGLDCRCIVLVSAMQEELNTSQERVKNNGET